MTMTDIKSMTQEEITDALRAMGEPAFRGKQVFSWLHKGATDFAEMNNLSKPLREKLGKEFTITAPTVARKQVSRLDGTVKYLWELRDGNCIETVLMSYHHGNTVCISSQVGCRMGCKFCASTIAGKVRDLTPSEMLDQVLFTQLDSGKDISNIVLMGIGEPLDNRANVLRFLQLVNHPEGLNIGMRHISLSTCGVVPGIDALAEETCSSRFPFRSTRRTARRAAASCRSTTPTTWRSCSPPATAILRKPAAASRLSTR